MIWGVVLGWCVWGLINAFDGDQISAVAWAAFLVPLAALIVAGRLIGVEAIILLAGQIHAFCVEAAIWLEQGFHLDRIPDGLRSIGPRASDRMRRRLHEDAPAAKGQRKETNREAVML